MSLAVKVLIALVAGLALGIGIASSGSASLANIVPVIEPIGTMWVAAIRMTIIPLVVASLIVGVGGAADPANVGRLTARTLVIFAVMVSVATFFAIVAGPPLIALIHIDAGAAAALRANAAQSAGAAVEGAKSLPGAAQWLIELVPANPIKAAADGAMLPLIVFSLLLGGAVSRIAADRRENFLRVIAGVQDAALLLVRWVILLAPLGIFALGVTVGAKVGVNAAGALVSYVLIVSGLMVAFCVIALYPAAVLIGGVPLGNSRGLYCPRRLLRSRRDRLLRACRRCSSRCASVSKCRSRFRRSFFRSR